MKEDNLDIFRAIGCILIGCIPGCSLIYLFASDANELSIPIRIILANISFAHVDARNAYDPIQPAIPHIIHQLWLGSTISEGCNASRFTWMHFAKTFDWEYQFWQEHDLERIQLHNQLFDERFKDTADYFRMSGDVARYEVLYAYGGVYVDCDMKWLGFDGYRGDPLRHHPTEKFIEMVDQLQTFAASPHYADDIWDKPLNTKNHMGGFFLASAVLISPKHSEFVDYLIKCLPIFVEKGLRVGTTASWLTTGPELVNRMFAHKGIPITFIPPIWIFSHSDKEAELPDLEHIAETGVMWGEYKRHIRDRQKHTGNHPVTIHIQNMNEDFLRFENKMRMNGSSMAHAKLPKKRKELKLLDHFLKGRNLREIRDTVPAT